MFKDIWNYNKKLIIIILSIILVGLIIVYSVISLKKDNSKVINNNSSEIEKIVLFGSKSITINEGENYVEPGYYALTKGGELKKEEIEVTGSNIDTNKAGIYYISYTIGNKKETRKVIVNEKEKKENTKETIGIITLTLKGDNMMVLNLGDEYKEPGYTASDTIDGDITAKVQEKGMVDTGTVGTYKIEYEVENSTSQKENVVRTIVVKNNIINAEITGNVTSYTNQNVSLQIKISGDNFDYLKNPDGTITKNKISTYDITKNGTYKFIIYDLDQKYIVKEVVVNKIDKEEPIGSCTATVTNGNTVIVADVNDSISGINKYVFYGNNTELKSQTESAYYYNKELTSASVAIYDNAGNILKTSCSIINKTTNKGVVKEEIKYDFLEMHFIVSGHNDDAIFIRSGKGSILIDSGRYSCRKQVVPYLKDLGVSTIDAMIGSHPHYNHIQAQANIIENFKVINSYYSVDLNTCASKKYCTSDDVLYIKDAINKNNIPMNVIGAGEIITVGDMTLYVIGPYTLNNTLKNMQNSNSLIFILKYKNNTFMFTGDAGPDTLSYKRLKPYANKLGISLDVDMFKYPHHGNANLDSDLLKVMTPKYVVIPNYGYTKYPSSTNRSKLTKLKANIYENGKDGNIVLKSDGNNISVMKKQSASTYKR